MCDTNIYDALIYYCRLIYRNWYKKNLFFQISLVSLCVFLLSSRVHGVVNNVSKTSNITESEKEEDSQASATNVNEDANRRESIVALQDTYGPPVPLDTYAPTGFNKQILPVPVYGVPDGPSNNIVYPPPPPDIPPPLSVPIDLNNNALNLGNTYGPPQPVYGPPKHAYGPPKFIPGPPKVSYGPPKPIYGPPKNIYGPPKHSYGPPKNIYGPPKIPPSPQYGLPPLKIPKPIHPPPKPIYGLPRPQKNPIPQYGVPLFKPVIHPIKPIYGPPKVVTQYGPPLFSDQSIPVNTNFIPPKVNFPVNDLQISVLNNVGSSNLFLPPPNTYGPPKNIYGPPKLQHHHLPPEPIPHGPPNPGVPAPPTPPDIKYDGWQPIPGLISKPPSVVSVEHQVNDLQFNKDFVPPPSGSLHISHGGTGLSSYATSSQSVSHSSHNVNSYNSAGLSDSYGAPLNTVTGSGGVVGHDNPLSHIETGGGNFDNSLSIIKSVGYELNGGDINTNSFGSSLGLGDSYISPPVDSFAPQGPYPPSKNQHFPILDTFNAFNGDSSAFSVDLTRFTDGLIPPSGVYGMPPNGKYGTPLLQTQHALDLKPPRNPVVFRKPVPSGLIESVGQQVAHSDAHNIIETHSNFNGDAYISPPVPDVTRPKNEYLAPQPSSLYSLPKENNPVSFQNIVHGNSQINGGGGHSVGFTDTQTGLNSYAAPLSAVEGKFSQGGHSSHHSVSQSSNYFGASNDLAGNYASKIPSYEAPVLSVPPPPHDCQMHKNFNQQQFNFATSQNLQHHGDLQTAYSVPDLNIANEGNSIIEPRGKPNPESEEGTEVIKSQSLDLNNIDVQGALGRYTLQIQPADGLQGATTVGDVPHNQVLNDGLLQSILAAIEQPQNQFNQQPYIAVPQGQILQEPNENEVQESVANTIAINPLNQNATILIPSQIVSTIPVLDNNSIAVYFNNTNAVPMDYSVKEKDDVNNNGQSGSFVSFNAPETSYTYGDLNSSSISELNIK